jgi:hypothetical protein
LLELEVAKIFLHHIGHCHAQRGGEILRGHELQLLRVFQQLDQTVRQALSIPGRVELDGEILALRHLAEVRKIGANHGHSISACQMSHAATSSGRRIWHNGHGGTLK